MSGYPRRPAIASSSRTTRWLGIREIQASEAKTHLPQLLDAVERGESERITRHARPIARLVPEAKRRRAEIDRAITNLRTLRRRTGKITVEELLARRHEGHKY